MDDTTRSDDQGFDREGYIAEARQEIEPAIEKIRQLTINWQQYYPGDGNMVLIMDRVPGIAEGFGLDFMSALAISPIPQTPEESDFFTRLETMFTPGQYVPIVLIHKGKYVVTFVVRPNHPTDKVVTCEGYKVPDFDCPPDTAEIADDLAFIREHWLEVIRALPEFAASAGEGMMTLIKYLKTGQRGIYYTTTAAAMEVLTTYPTARQVFQEQVTRVDPTRYIPLMVVSDIPGGPVLFYGLIVPQAGEAPTVEQIDAG
ncbi:hypothetical protein HGA91_04070 [candidate division WWE3 bacterium]|nr:hypothetical protein [candidate division WWE3 bacterium]